MALLIASYYVMSLHLPPLLFSATDILLLWSQPVLLLFFAVSNLFSSVPMLETDGLLANPLIDLTIDLSCYLSTLALHAAAASRFSIASQVLSLMAADKCHDNVEKGW